MILPPFRHTDVVTDDFPVPFDLSAAFLWRPLAWLRLIILHPAGIFLFRLWIRINDQHNFSG
ncbi:hypothetical protein VPH40_07140 [Janthinobacterium sp. P210005]|nr:hypothetical protein [Janthinobacterium sp. P210005]